MADKITESDEQLSSSFLSKGSEHLIAPDESEIQDTVQELNGKTLGEIASLLAQARKEAKTYKSQAREDLLTGLNNRRGVLHEEEEMRKRFSRDRHEGKEGLERVSVAMVDMVGLKKLNTEQGEKGGDEALRKLANGLTEGRRPGDIAGRWGGDEFVVILPNTTEDGAFTVLSRVEQSLPKGVDFVAIVGEFDPSTKVEDDINYLGDYLEQVKALAKHDDKGRVAESFGVVVASEVAQRFPQKAIAPVPEHVG